ncbi:AraC family transcriptional regulator [Amphritea sp. 1_MG-2023]|uniref:helix-turn-helix domain-containing protein n=1 Tax=Amphritea sp. 1_MG-2023 TaxID=3062670 RepID=UPI0026E42B7C|nr:AraC family transcriptional regulator [Amphritea sp. 1_MG-2023]MDO6562058.1 AraC family transcriptional regulator [Amphritea sp. 1_MG-2023]
MPDSKARLITPEQRLSTIPFEASETSNGHSFTNIRLENYARLPYVDLNLPGMDHHVMIYNYKPPAAAVSYHCAGQHYNGVWKRQSFAFIPAFQDNQWLIPEPDSSTLHILFPYTAVAKVMQESFNLDPSNLELQALFDVDSPVLQSLSELMFRDMQDNFASGNLYMESLANAAIIHLLKSYSNKSIHRHEEAGKITAKGLQQLISYIDQHLDQKITLDQMANQLNMSSYHFCRAFKHSSGYTPHQFVMLRRTYAARQRLLNSQRTPSQIAQTTGFSDQSHMNKQLQREFNMSASQIRAR